MSDAGVNAPHELPLLIGSGGGQPETLLLLGAVRNGRVTVRRWSALAWSASAEQQEEDADALLQWIESQARSGRSLNQELYAVRLWLRGEGTTSARR